MNNKFEKMDKAYDEFYASCLEFEVNTNAKTRDKLIKDLNAFNYFRSLYIREIKDMNLK